MFNRDALFGKKDEAARNETRPVNVNVTPSLGSGTPVVRQAPAEPVKADLRFSDTPAPRAPARAEESSGSKLIVGPDIKLRGVEITDCDTLVVEGRVEASMDSRVIQIAESGVFSGTVSIDVAEIRGHFEGTLTARKQLVIYATGRVSGTIRYGKIHIEEGGEISGEISTLSAAAAPETVATAAAASAPAATAATATATAAAPSPAAPPPAAVTPPSAAATGAARPAQPAAAAAALKGPQPSTLNLPQQFSRGGKQNKGSSGLNLP